MHRRDSKHSLDFSDNSGYIWLLSWIQPSHSLSSGSAAHTAGMEWELGWRSIRPVWRPSPLPLSLTRILSPPRPTFPQNPGEIKVQLACSPGRASSPSDHHHGEQTQTHKHIIQVTTHLWQDMNKRHRGNAEPLISISKCKKIFFFLR